jgi:HSP20 family protein
MMTGGQLMQHYHWNPMRELAEAQRQFSALFHNLTPQEPRLQNDHTTWTPAVDVYETPEAYVFTAELPGMKPEAVVIEVKENTLTIKGERPSVGLKEGERFHHRERPSGRFARVFRLPKPVAADAVAASYRDGILSVTVPLQVEAKSRKIPVQG